jgi:hypothetical protein
MRLPPLTLLFFVSLAAVGHGMDWAGALAAAKELTSQEWRPMKMPATLAAMVPVGAPPGHRPGCVVEVIEVGEVPHAVMIHSPFAAAVTTGERLLLAVPMRLLGTPEAGGQGQVAFKLQANRTPYHSVAQRPFRPGPEWRVYLAFFTARHDIPAGLGSVCLIVGGQVQTLELGPPRLWRFPPGKVPEKVRQAPDSVPRADFPP